ncbi:hypothetical protein E1293_26815 [Actinomadura darangshiensis]|uniref:Secreted protein n=1 Tax=Actinomadura darangshiensis TaxID=705336 RepID=A0A4R5AVX3_9ACTN|nr:hypothetical protein [Actinomadura darangshiensis]TDD76635.1 hypothetical protein E1293_26815 [Actinomadura darangshiensis]
MQRTVTRVLAAGAPLAALVATVPGVAHAAPDTAVSAKAAAAPLNPRDFELRRGADRSAPLRALGGRLHRSGVDALLRSSGQNKLGRGCGKAAGVPAHSLVYCFNRTDSVTRSWVPQGVTTVSDASAGERWAGGRPILVSWHNGGRVRLTFANPDRHTYRHVLLVAPYMKGRNATYSDIGIHAGGIAWYGNTLYVADTRHGVRTFDMRQIYDLSKSKAGSTGHASWVGLHGGKYYGHGFRYVMPQTGSWEFAHGKVGGKCRGSGPLRMSWLSIDRTTWPHSLVAGEYCRPNWPQGRVVTWRLGSLSGGGIARPSWGSRLPADMIQGAVRTHGTWWFTQSRGHKRGRLLTTTPTRHGWAKTKSRTISYGPEDLSCYRGQHRIWTVAEYPGKRALWSFRANSCS